MQVYQIWGGANSFNSNKIVGNFKFKFRSNTSLLQRSKENISEFHKVYRNLIQISVYEIMG